MPCLPPGSASSPTKSPAGPSVFTNPLMKLCRENHGAGRQVGSASACAQQGVNRGQGTRVARGAWAVRGHKDGPVLWVTHTQARKQAKPSRHAGALAPTRRRRQPGLGVRREMTACRTGSDEDGEAVGPQGMHTTTTQARVGDRRDGRRGYSDHTTPATARDPAQPAQPCCNTKLLQLEVQHNVLQRKATQHNKVQQ